MPVDGAVVTGLVVACSIVGIGFAALYWFMLSSISLQYPGYDSASGTAGGSRNGLSQQDGNEHLLQAEHAENGDEKEVAVEKVYEKVQSIGKAISDGANAFLYREYKYMGYFMIVFTVIIIVIIGASTKVWVNAVFAAIAFNVGAATSILCGFIGMRVAVYANCRTAIVAREGFERAFATSFRAGCIMGFSLVSIGVLFLYILLNFFRLHYSGVTSSQDDTTDMFEAISGYGLGGSSIALFGRVGGGIYTKAADVGADLVGKAELGIPEDDPRNPAVIADNVGDNVGDIAGMGADLFGSFAESSCAAMVIASQSPDLYKAWSYITFPLLITATGIIISLLTSFVATDLTQVHNETQIEPSLKRQLLISTILATPVQFAVCWFFLPSDPFIVSTATGVKNWHVFFCVAAGLWSGLLIGYTTEYYTSHAYTPVREVAKSCETGAATNIIYGLALGYKSVIIPVIALAVTIYIGYSLAAMYGIALAALGILSTLSIGLAIDAYGPICDNAGGIAEMAGMGPSVRARTDALDAAGNTTAAIGKGFAIGSAALVSLALFGGFLTIQHISEVDILQPFQFAGLLVGAMLPYWFSAMTMKSVGNAAMAMVDEVRRQLKNPKIMSGEQPPDYAECVGISTEAALKAMIAPGALVLLTPLIVGFFFGKFALAGVLAGALVSGVQIAISAANTGGAWDNAKKYIEGENLRRVADDGSVIVYKKGSEPHKAAVVGDTVGDPLKDTSGPSLNILVKLMAIISLVFARSFPSGRGLIEQLFHV